MEAVLVRTRKGILSGGGRGGSRTILGTCCLYNKYEVAGEVPLMAYRGAEGWRVYRPGDSLINV